MIRWYDVIHDCLVGMMPFMIAWWYGVVMLPGVHGVIDDMPGGMVSLMIAWCFIFWSVSRNHDIKSVSGAIERANMDGSVREVIVSDHLFLPTAIALDPVLEEIYWCDSVLGVIESADFNGFGRYKKSFQVYSV
ncbi:hypothetical protein AVEN_264424-1 [Araneus ventricosus]|uniref:Uncharacterized protein n=1 Tax=Araneus ventricosus TaxID=182803 RepID=A0A4Y2HUW5_ARAVE|nr:hypothetical protein AVEN_264424-1 [Araneus ventricosus]